MKSAATMTKDRTGEFKMACDHNKLDGETDQGIDCEGFQISEMQENQNLIKAMQTIITGIKHIYKEILLTIHKEESSQNELENLMTNMHVVAFNLRERLHKMENNIEMYQSENKLKPASLRIMRVQHSTLKHKFYAIMQEYNSIQLEYRDRCRERIRKELHVIGRDVTDDELEEILEQPLTKVFADCQAAQAQLTMNEVEARHSEILKLEQSIRETQSLFLNLSIIVENQKHIVNDIEYNIVTTEDYIERGEGNVKEAKRQKISARKKTLCLLVGLAVVVAVIIVAITF